MLYVLGNHEVENDQPPEAANVSLRSTGEQMVTKPPSTDKSVESNNQLPPKELRPSKLPLEAASDWINDDIVFCCKSSIWWLAFKEGEGMFCCLCKKHIKTGKNVKYATTPGTR